jgi:glutaredoxin
MHLKLYTKPGCPLCEEAADLLDELAGEVDFDLETVNIYESPHLFERYRYRVPVVSRDGKDVVELRFTLDELRKAISAS